MAKYSKFNIVYLLQKWMDSVAGQTFMNYAYSWGAAVVILGTLFKLTHLPGANTMLFIGMGTEVFVFFISAFDRPFDKTADGMELATDSQIAALAASAASAVGSTDASPVIIASGSQAGTNAAPVVVPTGNDSEVNGTVIIGQSVVPQVVAGSPISFVASGDNTGVSVTDEVTEGVVAPATTQYASGSSPVIGAPAPAVSPETAEAMEEATTTYVDRLNELNELLLKVSAQSERLTTDSEEMENLNRTLTGIARVYEMQLKSASQQITTQDAINEQTAKMAAQIQELNAIYARMIDAMTTNLPK